MSHRGFQKLLVGAGCLLAALPGHGQDAMEMSGEAIVIQAENFEQHRSDIQYYLENDTDGRSLRLRFAEGKVSPSLATGSRIRVRGHVLGDEFVVQSAPARLESEEMEATTIAGAEEHRTLVIAVNFRNVALTCQTNTIAETLFSGLQSVDALYREMSHDAVGFSGDVVGPFTIDYDGNAGGCEYFAWGKAADVAALAAGIPVSQYQHKVYVLPHLNPCSWTGLATIGGNPGRVWVGQCQLADVYAHELGHNLGLQHASADYNNDGRKDCEYCDNSDIMGYVGPGLRQFNAPHKEQLGWLPAEKTVTLAGPGVVQLSPLEFAPEAAPYPQALKIARPDGGSTYYFSYRRSLGFDVNLLDSYRDTLSVHYFAGATNRSYLVTTLADRERFADPASGLTVTLSAHDENSATVQVAYECYGVAPTVSLECPTINAVAGMTTSTVVTVVNRDSPACSPATFQLAAAAPSGWSVVLSPASLTLAPGQSGAVRVSVTLPAKSRQDSHTLMVSVSDLFNSAHAASASQTITMAPLDDIPPSAPNGLRALQGKRTTRVRWDPASDNVGVTGYVIWRDGTVIGSSRRRRFRDATAEVGVAYHYTVTAIDAAGNTSVPSDEVLASIPTPVAAGQTSTDVGLR